MGLFTFLAATAAIVALTWTLPCKSSLTPMDLRYLMPRSVSVNAAVSSYDRDGEKTTPELTLIDCSCTAGHPTLHLPFSGYMSSALAFALK